MVNQLLLSGAISVLSPLTLSQQLDVIEGYSTQMMCHPYLNQDAQIYLRELVFHAGKRKPASKDFFAGIRQAISEGQVKFRYNRNYCINALPKAFKQAETIKLIK